LTAYLRHKSVIDLRPSNRPDDRVATNELEPFPINIVDLVILIVLLVSGFLAFFRGFVHEVLAVAGWVGAAFVTLYMFPLARPYVRAQITTELVADGVTIVVIFLIALVVLTWVSHQVSKRVRDSALSALDRSLGFLFGVLRGAVLICIAWLAFAALVPPEEHPGWIQEARALPLVERGGSWLRALVPGDGLEDTLEPAKAALEKSEAAARRVQKLTAPSQATTAPDNAPETGYKGAARKMLERLIQNPQDQKE